MGYSHKAEITFLQEFEGIPPVCFAFAVAGEGCSAAPALGSVCASRLALPEPHRICFFFFMTSVFPMTCCDAGLFFVIGGQ